MLAVVLLHQGEKIELERGGGHLVEPQKEASTTEGTVMKLGESESSVTASESDLSVGARGLLLFGVGLSFLSLATSRILNVEVAISTESSVASLEGL